MAVHATSRMAEPVHKKGWRDGGEQGNKCKRAFGGDMGGNLEKMGVNSSGMNRTMYGANILDGLWGKDSSGHSYSNYSQNNNNNNNNNRKTQPLLLPTSHNQPHTHQHSPHDPHSSTTNPSSNPSTSPLTSFPDI